MPAVSQTERSGELDALAYPPPLRFARAGLLVIAAGVLVVLLFRQAAIDPLLPSSLVLRAVASFALLPWVAAYLVRRALRARISIERGVLKVQVGGQAFDVALDSIAAVEPWRVPLPEPGFVLRLESGERFPLGLAAREPTPLLEALADAGVASAREATSKLVFVWARAKAWAGPWTWRHLAVKYPLFALVPGGLLLHAHQSVAWGGLMGQWHLESPVAWAWTAFAYWLTATVHLVLYASAWRAVVELASLVGAAGGDAAARRTRRLAELIARLAYYAGVPLLLAQYVTL
ncbi:MAG TPA: hypothetical protein VIS07_21960 [Candidatus Binatia bacterium]